MKYTPDITLEQWSTLVLDSENIRAKKKLAAGRSPELVLEEMAIRIQKKILHFLIMMEKRKTFNFDTAESRIRYINSYSSFIGPRADQALD